MNKIFLWGFVVIVLGAAGWAVFALSGTSNDTPHGGGSELSLPVSSRDHTKGGGEAEVVLVEYGDFQCPACAAFFPLIKQLELDFTGQLQIVYRHFPLTRIHPKATDAARAAEAAGAQGKFWEMHDMLFQNQAEWVRGDEEELFWEYAGRLGLDLERFSSDLESDAVGEKVQEDLQSAVASQAPGTPTFFLQGRQIPTPQSYEQFQELITAALQNAVRGQDGSVDAATEDTDRGDENSS